MSKRLLLTNFAIIVLIFSGCKAEGQSQIGLYDISNDDKSILFSFADKNSSSIFQINTNGTSLKSIISATPDSIYLNPKYSTSGSRILFIGRPKNTSYNSSIYIANSDGTKKQIIIADQGIITEAIFSKCDDKIYYCKANEYGHYSPAGTDQAHDEDIYSIDLKTKKVNRITKLKAYGIFYISEYDCDHILMNIPVPYRNGMIKILKGDSMKADTINPNNHPRDNPDLYSTPRYSEKYNTFGFIATYELRIMNMRDNMSKVVVNHAGMPQIDDFLFLHQKKSLIFTTVSENTFYIVNFDGSGLAAIKLPK